MRLGKVPIKVSPLMITEATSQGDDVIILAVVPRSREMVSGV
jgi:hypothetical protein